MCGEMHHTAEQPIKHSHQQQQRAAEQQLRRRLSTIPIFGKIFGVRSSTSDMTKYI